MPLYFAYGSHMDEVALRTRCPKARMLSLARLARHRFVLMANGYASVRRDPGSDVHGVLFELALSDVPPLDRYEETGNGLYTKALQPVVRQGGAAVQALIYIGTDVQGGGSAGPAYMEGVIAAAKTVGLPAAYVAMLEQVAGRGGAPGSPLAGRFARPPL
jgi:cation transport regulator ChaC